MTTILNQGMTHPMFQGNVAFKIRKIEDVNCLTAFDNTSGNFGDGYIIVQLGLDENFDSKSNFWGVIV